MTTGEDESTEKKADTGSAAMNNTQSDISRVGASSSYETRTAGRPREKQPNILHSYLTSVSAEMVVVMEMASQHVITKPYKNRNIGALHVG